MLNKITSGFLFWLFILATKFKLIKPIVTFSSDVASKKFILEALGYSVDVNGYISDNSLYVNVKDRNGKNIHVDDFLGIYKEKILTSWIDLIDVVDDIQVEKKSNNL